MDNRLRLDPRCERKAHHGSYAERHRGPGLRSHGARHESVRGEIQRDCKVPLTIDEKIALLDFIYNLGGGNFRSSTLLRKLNAGDYAGAAAEFDNWDHAGGKVLAGLLKRRQAETDLFNKDIKT